MICRFIELALGVLLLLMFKSYRIFGIVGIELFLFCSNERVKHNQIKKKKKNHLEPTSLVRQSRLNQLKVKLSSGSSLKI